MTKDEYKAIKKKGSDLRERVRKRLNVPELPAVSDENYDKIRSIYNSADKQVTKFLNNLESKEFFKTWYPIEYLSEKDVEDIAVIVISRMGNGTTDRKILDNIKKGYLYGNYRFLLYGHRNCDDSIFVEDPELLKYKDRRVSIAIQNAQQENNAISKPCNLCQSASLLVPLLNLRFQNDDLENILVCVREQINRNVYKPDLSWVEAYINYVDQMVDNLFWLILPYGIKRFYTKKVEESETGAYTYVLNDDLQSRGFKTHNDVYSFIASKHDQIQKELEERLKQIDFKSTNFIEYSDMRAYSYCKRRAINIRSSKILDDSLAEINESEPNFFTKLKDQIQYEEQIENNEFDVPKENRDSYNKNMDRVRLYLKMLEMNGFTNVFTNVPDLERIVYREVYVFKKMNFKKECHDAQAILKRYTDLMPWIKPKNHAEAEKVKNDIFSYGYFGMPYIDHYDKVKSLLLKEKGYLIKKYTDKHVKECVEMISLSEEVDKNELKNELNNKLNNTFKEMLKDDFVDELTNDLANELMVGSVNKWKKELVNKLKDALVEEFTKEVKKYNLTVIHNIIGRLNGNETPFLSKKDYVEIARLDEHRLFFLYSKFKRGYMVKAGFLSVYEDYVQIRKNVMEELLFVYRFRDDIEIFKAIHFIGQAYIDMIINIFEPEED